MSIEVKPGRYYAAIWFVRGHDQDFLAALYRELPEPMFRMTYRFRYYNDDKAFDSKDDKHWYETNDAILEEDRGIRAMDDVIAEMLQVGYGGPVTKLLLRTDDPEIIMQELRKQDFIHVGKKQVRE